MAKFLDSTGLTRLWDKIKSQFQEVLVSGTNIKTINNTSILGSGDITTPDTTYSAATTSANGLMSSTDKSNLDGLVDTILTNGSGTQYLTNAGTYINPFPVVSEEEALTILADGTISHRSIQTMKEWDATMTDYDLDYLNSTYSDSPVGFQLVLYANEKIYEKVSSTNQWVVINCALME